MNVAEKAFKELFPEKQEYRIFTVKYSAAFKDYNANVNYNNHSVNFRLSRKWKNISDDIKIGLIQGLLLKIYKAKKNTINIELYNKFIKNMSDYAVKNKTDPILEKAFHRVNERFFYNMMDKPNLVFGNRSFSKLGSYEYATDTIVVSSLFRHLKTDEEKYLDYVMYHELLHKKHKFYTKNNRSFHHTRTFREQEMLFGKEIEKELKKFLRKKRFFSLLRI